MLYFGFGSTTHFSICSVVWLTFDANVTDNVWTELSYVVSGVVTRGAISWWHWERCFEFRLRNETVESESIHGTDGSGPCIAIVAQAGFVNFDIVEMASSSCKFPFTWFEGLAEFFCQDFSFWVIWAFASGCYLSSRSFGFEFDFESVFVSVSVSGGAGFVSGGAGGLFAVWVAVALVRV